VRIIVGFAAGGPADTVARPIGQWLSERLGQPFVVDHRSGANGNIGTEAVVRAPPDGYTLLMALAVNAINAAVYDNLSFNFALMASWSCRQCHVDDPGTGEMTWQGSDRNAHRRRRL